jgi:hypothetical protein
MIILRASLTSEYTSLPFINNVPQTDPVLYSQYLSFFVTYKQAHWGMLHYTSGLYYKHILTIVSDDRKWRQYYKCTINVIDDASLALA